MRHSAQAGEPPESEEVTMSLASLIWMLLIGLVAGWIAGQLTKGRGFGLVGNLVVGVVGSLLGGLLFSVIGLAAYGLIAQILMAVIGALVLLFLLSLIRR